MKPLDRTRAKRAAIAAALGGVWGLMANGIMRATGPARMGSDFTYPWFAARALLHGIDPYKAIERATLPYGHNLFYPLPAAIAAIPFAPLEARAADVAFVFVSAAVLAYVATAEAWWPLALFLSAPAYMAAAAAQWSLLLAAAGLAAPLLLLVAVKPNFALPLVLLHANRRALAYAAAGGAVLVAASFLLVPAWLGEWLAQVRFHPLAVQYHAPILTVWGAPVALAALAWRDRRARLLVALACMPQNFFFYDQLLVLLVAETRVELLALCVVSWIAFLPAHLGGAVAFASARLVPYVVVGFYWPAAVIVLVRNAKESQMRIPVRRSVLAVAIVAAAFCAFLVWFGGVMARVGPH